MNTVVEVPIQKVTEEGKTAIKDVVTREYSLTIILNNRELVTLLCSPAGLKYLAIGFLVSEGLVKKKDDIRKIVADDQKGTVWVETKDEQECADELSGKRFIASSGGRGSLLYRVAEAKAQKKSESQLTVSAAETFALMEEFTQRSQVHKMTGGVHSAALCEPARILMFAEDIGRHNAIDKIFGQCLLEEIPAHEHILLTSGRISSEMLLKAARGHIPVMISKSAPTDVGVQLANELGITLIGFVRGKRMNVYANEWRVIMPEKT